LDKLVTGCAHHSLTVGLSLSAYNEGEIAKANTLQRQYSIDQRKLRFYFGQASMPRSLQGVVCEGILLATLTVRHEETLVFRYTEIDHR